ncbi:MAG: hypothetical protein RIR00_2467 [Pseudomonadota bacterium]|jgi:pimeloyl-ACP methyl ester carboxylesterase
MRLPPRLLSHLRPATLLAATTLLLAGCASSTSPQDARPYTLSGQGKPVVVLQSGLGDDRHSWQSLVPTLAQHYTVFAYDRPGSGAQPLPDGPRDPCTIASELRATLREAGLTPPYLLVGHSLGGLYQYTYASLFPQDVAGFVLVDPTHPRNWAAIQQQLPGTAALLKTLKTVAFSSAERREFDAQGSCLDRPEFARPPGVPGRVLIAGQLRAADPEEYQALRLNLAREWPRLAGIPAVEMIWDSAHYIHRERPDAVIRAIRQLASPGQCDAACGATTQRLDSVSLGDHPPFDILFGQTRRADIEARLGAPRRTQAVPDQAGAEVRAYHRKPDKAHPVISLIPVLGDLVDAVQVVNDLQDWPELVVEYTPTGLVRYAGLRKVQ